MGVAAGEQRGPVDVHAAHPKAGDGVGEGLDFVVVAAGCGYEHAVGGFGGHRGECGVRAQLQELGHARFGERAEAVGEADGLTDVTDPVGGSADVLGGDRSGQVRDERDARGGVGDGGRHLLEVGEHRLHQRRVESVGDLQATGLDPRCREAFPYGFDGFLGTREHHGRRPVDGGHVHTVQILLNSTGLDGEHGSTGRQRLHQRTPRGNQAAGILQREHTRHMSGDDFTDGVAHHKVRTHTPRLHQPIQSHFHSEQT
ncbi:hypothetical protein GA0115233_102858, partial [Streptomyces sp. DI166]